jgi:hypothetical protein
VETDRWAALHAYRVRGSRSLATETVTAAFAELQQGLKRGGIKRFCVEAMIDVSNVMSQRVAVKTISDKPVETPDSISGLPALRYVREIGE